ncbi:hypothetical protein SAMN04488509_10660 [Aquimonas voraii]|uniref:Uncharacterized protein n=1 Tax=Aquimonas voraii TaxID=265719 RepID=A0A1G6X6A4_9GAMM|nr:hypothetical protein SAMN04488509_10660 [Aquimonas voraii]
MGKRFGSLIGCRWQPMSPGARAKRRQAGEGPGGAGALNLAEREALARALCVSHRLPLAACRLPLAACRLPLPLPLPLAFAAGSEEQEQELSVSPAGCPTYLSLRGHCAAGAARTPKAAPEGRRAGCPESRKVGQRKATPRPRPSRIRARRVRVSPWVFVDRPSLACHEHRRPPCRRPCGRIHELPPLPRGPVQERGLLPARAGATATASRKPQAAGIGWALAHRKLRTRPDQAWPTCLRSTFPRRTVATNPDPDRASRQSSALISRTGASIERMVGQGPPYETRSDALHPACPSILKPPASNESRIPPGPRARRSCVLRLARQRRASALPPHHRLQTILHSRFPALKQTIPATSIRSESPHRPPAGRPRRAGRCGFR